MWSTLTNWLNWSADRRIYSETKLGSHQWGEYSMAAVKYRVTAHCSIHVQSGPMSLGPFGPNGTFVGIYDGHGGHQAAEFMSAHLYETVRRSLSDVNEMSVHVLDSSLLALEREYLQSATNEAAASRCLVCVSVAGRLYIANVGDCKAVFGKLVETKGCIPLILRGLADNIRPPIQACELPLDSHLFLHLERGQLNRQPRLRKAFHYNDYSWFAKGLVPTTRSIGDVYMQEDSDLAYAPILVEIEPRQEDEFIILGSPRL